jgi:hypothetical protein
VSFISSNYRARPLSSIFHKVKKIPTPGHFDD